MKKILLLPLVLSLLLVGCSTLNPNADPFVVRVEQAQTTAYATFDFVLHMDQANRGFWMTNAPAFHGFCEWLRTPMTYTSMGTPRADVPRCVVMQLNVDDVKVAYKLAKTSGNSNALYLAFATLNAALGQAASWSNIVSSPTHP